MRDRSGRKAVRAWLCLAVAAAAVAVAATVAFRNHRASRPAPPTSEPARGWNDEVRLDVCLSLRDAPRTSDSDEANLQIEGTLLGSGPLPPGARQPMDTGNVIGCVDEPQRYIDVQDDSRQTWRIMYALTTLDPSPFPEQTLDTRPTPRTTPALRAPATLRARVGSHVRFRFDAVDYAGKLAGFMLLDESGPLIGVEAGWSGLREGDGGPFAISWGRPFERGGDECGERVTRALQISGDTEVSVPPGETRSVERRIGS